MQSAMNALNPVKSIGAQFRDAMRAHGTTSRDEIGARSAEVLRMVGIDRRTCAATRISCRAACGSAR